MMIGLIVSAQREGGGGREGKVSFRVGRCFMCGEVSCQANDDDDDDDVRL